jgi:hypothetical protein
VCPAGLVGAIGGYACALCGEGTSSPAGAHTCTACKPGSATWALAGASACARCVPGATLLSTLDGCLPHASPFGEPPDTAFYLSGSAYESASAMLAAAAQGITHAVDARGVAGGALALVAGSHLTSSFSAAPTLAIERLQLSAAGPGPASPAFTLAAWVSCPSSMEGAASVLEFGAAGPAASAAKAALLAASTLPTLFSYAASDANVLTVASGLAAPTALAVNATGGTVLVVGAGSGANAVLAVSLATGTVKLLAGSATGDAAFADGTGAVARFSGPRGLALDPSGAVFVADCGNNRIRVVSPLGVVSTLVGSGAAGSTNAAGTSASFNCPSGVALSADGANLFVADSLNHRIRKVTITGSLGIAGSLCGSTTSVAGAADGQGGGASFNTPAALVLYSPAGGAPTLIVADSGNGRVRAVTGLGTAGSGGAFGVVTTLATAGAGLAVRGVATDVAGTVFFTAGNALMRLASAIGGGGGGGAATLLAGELTSTAGVATDGTGTSARFSAPSGLAFVGNMLLVADTGGSSVRRVLQRAPLPGALPVCDGTWHHAALTYSADGSASALLAFVDGDLVGQGALALSIPDLGANEADGLALRVGWGGLPPSAADAAFVGALSDLRIYARALAPSEVSALKSVAALWSGCSEAGTFLSHLGVCLPITVCGTGAAYANTPALPTADAVCTCAPSTAFGNGAAGAALVCRTCSACAAGFAVSQPCSALADTVCVISAASPSTTASAMTSTSPSSPSSSASPSGALQPLVRVAILIVLPMTCLLYTSPSPRD